MSYSRWSGSHWYTFWRAPSVGVTETRDNALFEICMVASFTAKELREDMDKCAEQAAIISGEDTQTEITSKLKEELKSYMREFLADVDLEYPNHHAGEPQNGSTNS